MSCHAASQDVARSMRRPVLHKSREIQALLPAGAVNHQYARLAAVARQLRFGPLLAVLAPQRSDDPFHMGITLSERTSYRETS